MINAPTITASTSAASTTGNNHRGERSPSKPYPPPRSRPLPLRARIGSSGSQWATVSHGLGKPASIPHQLLFAEFCRTPTIARAFMPTAMDVSRMLIRESPEAKIPLL